MANDFGDIFSDIFGTNIFGGTAEGYQRDLDKYWCKHMESYYITLNNAKNTGFKVFRNKDGKHKVVRR